MRSYALRIIAVCLVLLVGAFFVARVELTQAMWPVSLCAIILFSAPVVYGILSWAGWKKGGLIIGVLGIYAFSFEAFAVRTGVPYGEFQYSGLLGPKIADTVPFAVFLAWTPLVLGTMAMKYNDHAIGRIIVATCLLVLIDSVLDPAAVYLGFWSWSDPGFYHGVPLVNFFGWIVSGGIAITLMYQAKNTLGLGSPPALLRTNLLAIIVFWSFVNLFALQLVPFCIGIGLSLLFILRFCALDHRDATLER